MSALTSIEHQLKARFAQPGEAGRVVLWCDPDAAFADAVDGLDLPDVTVLRVANNEFHIKRRVYHDEPNTKFLVYRPAAAPADRLQNWLLDMELAYGVFTTDPESLVVQELGSANPALPEVVRAYPAFFKANERVAKLKPRIGAGDDATDITATMVAIIVGSQQRSLDAIWRALLTEYAHDKSTSYDEIVRLGLADFHWAGTRGIYGYAAADPTVEDFTLWLFNLAWTGFASPSTPARYANIQRDVSTLSHDPEFADTYRQLADRAAAALGIARQAAGMTLPDLMPRLTFHQADQQIIADLVRGVADRTLLDRDVHEMARRRVAGTWYGQFAHHYDAIVAASTLLTLTGGFTASLASPAEGFRRYKEEWFAIDQAYRQFTYHNAKTGDDALEPLTAAVEPAYTAAFVRPLANAWQQQVDTLDAWRITGVPQAASFFADRVRPWLDRATRIVVIASDALRFEVADELARRIRHEDGFSAELDAMLSVFPSYTQLGMAALLPHETLAFADGGGGFVSVDGAVCKTTEARGATLAPFGGAAIQAAAFLELSRDQRRDLVKANKVLYIFHNQIDHTGDTRDTETSVFDACDKAISELVDLVKKLAGANAGNVIITADHGFLYQNTQLGEHDYLSEPPHGDKLLMKNHRFVLGRDLAPRSAYTRFTPAQLGLVGDIEAAVPKSMQRLKLPGGGVRYVHGGAALQEIVVPVVTVNKGRTKDVRHVSVRVLTDTNRITTGRVTVTLFQEEPVTDKVRPRRLRVGLYAGGTLISNEVTLDCSQESSEPRDRYFPITLTLSHDADAFDGRSVELLLFEPVGTSGRRPYPTKAVFTLVRNAFGSDF
jgi:uncharacterized protein (TIGR02687 family)